MNDFIADKIKLIFAAIGFIICVGVIMSVFSAIAGMGKKLPQSSGKDENVLVAELKEMNQDYVIMTDYEFNENVTRGLVSRISPASGTRVKKGSAVTVIISKGKPITVSDYTNTDSGDVKNMLTSLGLNFECTQEFSEDVEKGNVISTDPASGTVVEEGTTVSIVISDGSMYRTIPNYSGMTFEEFASKCDELEIRHNDKKEFTSDVERGQIIRCNYAEGDKISYTEETVDIVYSVGEGIEIPDLTGKTVEEARSILEDAGLKASESVAYSDVKKGLVCEQGEPAGNFVEEGSIVTLVVSKGTEEQEFKDQCETPSYDELIRNPSKYESTPIGIKVKVGKVENETILGIKYGETIWATYQGYDIIITDGRELPEPAIRAGDTITIYGYGNGNSTVNVKQKTYQGSLVFGFSYNKTVDSYDIPNVKALYVSF